MGDPMGETIIIHDEIPQVVYWCGRKISDLTKDELIDVVNWCANEIVRIREQHQRDLAILIPWSGSYRGRR
jgi:hypothetical protein